jgi:hypothetical protein
MRPPGAALDHVTADLAGEEEASAQVDAGHRVPRFLADRQRRVGLEAARARGMNEQADRVEALQRAVEQRAPAVALAEIAREEIDPVLRRRRLDVAAEDRRAFGFQRNRDAAADAAAAAGDEGALALQQICGHSSFHE